MASLTNSFVFVAGTALLAQAAVAQSLHDFQHNKASDTRASAAITIPLGAKRGTDKAAARFDFTVSTHSLAQQASVTPLRVELNNQPRALRAAKLSFTLEENPRLLFNDQRIATFGPRLTADEDENTGGLGAGGWVLVGLGAAIGGGFLIAQIVEDDIADNLGVDN